MLFLPRLNCVTPGLEADQGELWGVVLLGFTLHTPGKIGMVLFNEAGGFVLLRKY